MKNRIQRDCANARNELGLAIVPVLLVVSGLAVFTMALLTATLSGSRSSVLQEDDYKISSAVETSAVLAMELMWSGFEDYARANSLSTSIGSFQNYMDSLNVPDQSALFDADGNGIVELIPTPGQGTDILLLLNLPTSGGNSQINRVNIDAVEVVRVDFKPNPPASNFDRSQIFLTVSASTTRGGNLVNPIMNRAVQQVFTVEPEEFSGFDYALLSNNVNCIFCHTNIDSVERQFNIDPGNYGTFGKVRVGTLESLLVRHNMDGNAAVLNDYDADSFVAGSLYMRGSAVLHDGSPLPNWADLSLMGYQFDGAGNIVEDAWGDLILDPFVAASLPFSAGENLYLNYPIELEEQVDGAMPAYFPAPIPDDGGLDPSTGLPNPAAVGNRIVDDAEFAKVASSSTGAITAGVVNVTPSGATITTLAEYAAAVMTGNSPSINNQVAGNVILTGSRDNPIRIDGNIAIDGDVVIQGWVQGEGSIIARGNIYIPTDLTYLDGLDENNKRTFGQNGGYTNAVGLTAGGNIIIGDYQRPATLQPNFTWVQPGKTEIITGQPNDDWSFALAEMSLFNRGEWSKTQIFLPGPFDDTNDPLTWTVLNPDNRTNPLYPGLGEDPTDPTTWTAANPSYDPLFRPRYYGYGEETIIPIHNRVDETDPASLLYYDPNLRTWIGDEVAIGWDPTRLTYADPLDPVDPILYPTNGLPTPVQIDISPDQDWIAPDIYQKAAEYFHDNRGPLSGRPMSIDGLLYTNNAIFSLVNRSTDMRGRMVVNGALVAADLGMLTPGHPLALPPNNTSQLSGYSIGLQLNYDQRVKKLLNVTNPFRVQLKRTLWNPTANLL